MSEHALIKLAESLDNPDSVRERNWPRLASDERRFWMTVDASVVEAGKDWSPPAQIKFEEQGDGTVVLWMRIPREEGMNE